MESKILSTIANSKDAFEQIQLLVDKKDFSDSGYIIYESIRDFYLADDNATAVDISLLCDSINRRYPKHGSSLCSVVNAFEAVSAPNVIKEFHALKKQRAALALGHALISESPSVQDELEAFVQLSSSPIGASDAESVFCGASLDSFVEAFSKENLIRVLPAALNERLGGGVPRGTHLLIYARPEIGKSLFALNMAYGFCKDGRRTLYVGNEDPHTNMLLRFVSRATSHSKEAILDNPEQAEQEANANGYGNLIFASLSPGTTREIRKLIKQYEPEILIVDQLPNLASKDSEKIQKMENLATEMRNIAKSQNMVVVSVCQAGDSASNKLCLDIGDVYYSNTGIPAQMDVMIGIGANQEYINSGRRMISLTKNKVTGNHDSFTVFFDPSINKVSST